MTFEEWIKSNGGSTDRRGGGEYRSALTEYTRAAWQVAYAAGRASALEDAAKKVEEVHEFYGVAPAETIRSMK